jgi:hypothetical protein
MLPKPAPDQVDGAKANPHCNNNDGVVDDDDDDVVDDEWGCCVQPWVGLWRN